MSIVSNTEDSDVICFEVVENTVEGSAARGWGEGIPPQDERLAGGSGSEYQSMIMNIIYRIQAEKLKSIGKERYIR